MGSEIHAFGTTFKNPILPASGTFGYGDNYSRYYDPAILGALVSKGITWNPKSGNSGIRIYETPSGILNSIGLENPGTKGFLAHSFHAMKKLNDQLIINVGGNTEEEYLQSVELLNDYDFTAIELNISCPNVKHGGMAFGIETETAAAITKTVKAHTRHPLIVKLSPNARDIVECAKAVEEAGADGVSLINTILGMAIDPYSQAIIFENTYAGLSGPAVKPIALRMVHQVAKVLTIPIVAEGGITTAGDVVEFLLAGASLVEVGTANFMNPRVIQEIIEGFNTYLEEMDTTAENLIGKLV
ncbi:dihydroorotate dehydrogenase [Peptoniphilus equinus]|uniref:Dihydroorotate dehydrogenase n=1 Tax=Peptoniphilus equinus TaxID=3016343 RepID=A0ABY7QSL6_9FIRM|nr:dihydroorotate dehydrogenase [Peptoniphilus equinus]WBW49788.1 dihydroorotate dehydrogenase [Peptoniphilus equinus]